MKKLLKAIMTTIILSLFVSLLAFAEDNNGLEAHITMSDIYSKETEIISVSDVSAFMPEKENGIEPQMVPKKVSGKYPIYTIVVTEKSSSAGLKLCSSKVGTYASIASFALSFISGVPAMRVSQILGAVSLAVGGDTYTQAKTFISYIEYRKKGEARWSNFKSYNTYVMSGKRNYYKHVLGGKRKSNLQWTTKTRDYLDKPAKVVKGTFYDKPNSWYKEQARQRLLTGSMLIDLPW